MCIYIFSGRKIHSFYYIFKIVHIPKQGKIHYFNHCLIDWELFDREQR